MHFRQPHWKELVQGAIMCVIVLSYSMSSYKLKRNNKNREYVDSSFLCQKLSYNRKFIASEATRQKYHQTFDCTTIADQEDQ